MTSPSIRLTYRLPQRRNGKPDCAVNAGHRQGRNVICLPAERLHRNGMHEHPCVGAGDRQRRTRFPMGRSSTPARSTCAQSANTKYTLGVTGVIFSDPSWQPDCGSPGCDGAVVAGTQPTPTGAATQGATNTPTATATATSTPPPVTSPTVAHTATATATRTAILSGPVLGQDINATVTTFTVAGDLSTLPQSNGTIQVDAEQMRYDSLSGSAATPSSATPKSGASGSAAATGALIGVHRGANGTTAAAHTVGTRITVITAAPFSDDDGGCNISTTGSSSAGWLLLIPAIGLLVLRRRSR